MEVKDILTAAARAVDDAKLADKFRVAAFTKAVDLIAGPVRQADPAKEPAREGPAGRAAAGGGKLELIAGKLGLSVEDVSEVYAEDKGELDIVISPTKLDNKKMGATKELALLVAAGRQGAAVDEWTTLDSIRHFAEEFKKYDAPNFARAIRGMGDTFRYTGSGGELKVKLGRPGWEQATALVKGLAGGK